MGSEFFFVCGDGIMGEDRNCSYLISLSYIVFEECLGFFIFF